MKKKIMKKEIKRRKGYLYYIDKQTGQCRGKMSGRSSRGGKFTAPRPPRRAR